IDTFGIKWLLLVGFSGILDGTFSFRGAYTELFRNQSQILRKIWLKCRFFQVKSIYTKKVSSETPDSGYLRGLGK
ncbi:MAG: hypothetical protein PUK34_02730, partial [Clostridia bacterium]|nr:hypothetical protein [Clostridia bacterium]MDY5664159.1 hypothetical protein [Blautia sp.]